MLVKCEILHRVNFTSSTILDITLCSVPSVFFILQHYNSIITAPLFKFFVFIIHVFIIFHYQMHIQVKISWRQFIEWIRWFSCCQQVSWSEMGHMLYCCPDSIKTHQWATPLWVTFTTMNTHTVVYFGPHTPSCCQKYLFEYSAAPNKWTVSFCFININFLFHSWQ